MINDPPHQTTNSSIERLPNWCLGALRELANTGRTRKQMLSMLVDFALAIICLWSAYTLRHGLAFSDFRSTWYLFLLIPVATVGCFFILGVYRWVIRSTNQRLFRQLLKGSLLTSVILLIAFTFIPPDRANPRSLFVIFALLLFVCTTGVRIIWKTLFESTYIGEPIAVFGAGSAGQQLVNLLCLNNKFNPVMFIDDNSDLKDTTVLGLSVAHPVEHNLQTLLQHHEVKKVVLAIPSLSTAQYHQKVQRLGELGITIQTMPGIAEIMDGSARVDEIRDVSIADILGRTEVAPNVELMGKRVTGKTVLVTGGGGSIGSELCRQIMKLNPLRLVVLDNCEANLYHLNEEFKHTWQNESALETSPRYVASLGSVLDHQRVDRLMAEYEFDTVYHAAAYKHVPIVEAQPDQGVDVNVFGTKTMLDSAIAHGVSDFVLISTDKAVRPTNAMGASKRVAEMVLQATAAEESGTRISMVRFGNVLGSSGSVVPKFKRQILEGGPITLTHSEVTRYFMTIPEASQLVLQASAIASGGEVFVLDMGEPVRIEDLAVTMVRLFGKRLHRETGNVHDIEIIVEGLRPGEKMYEELFITENSRQTAIPKVTAATESWLSWSELMPRLQRLRQSVKAQNTEDIKTQLLSLAFFKDEQPKTDEAKTSLQ